MEGLKNVCKIFFGNLWSEALNNNEFLLVYISLKNKLIIFFFDGAPIVYFAHYSAT
jgi:hypothetical protein